MDKTSLENSYDYMAETVYQPRKKYYYDSNRSLIIINWKLREECTEKRE
jgi:hypothetical protein